MTKSRLPTTAASAPPDTGVETATQDLSAPPTPAEPPGTDTAPVRRARTRRRLLVNLCRVSVLVTFLGLWQLLAATRTIDPFYFGEPSGVWARLWTWTLHGTSQGPLWIQIRVTLEETLLGFGIGVGLGVVCGIVLGRLPLLADVFGPYLKTLNSIPRIVLGAVFAIWFGLGIGSKAALAAVLVFFGVFFNAFQGAREVDGELLANARILGAKRAQITWQVVIPSALSWITTSLHTAFGFAITGAIVGELLGAQQGLGLLISQAQANFDPDAVYAGLVITAVVALAAEGLITLVERRLLRWRPRPRTDGAET